MLAFHMMHQNARKPVLERHAPTGLGTLCMFAVRNIFSKPGAAGEDRSASWSPRASCRARCRRQEPARLPGAPGRRREHRSMPPTASRGTSPASTWCCSAPAASITCAPTSPRSCARLCRRSTCRSSMPCSATLSASASTFPTGSLRRHQPASLKCRQLAKPAGRIPAGCVLGWLRHNVRALMTQTSASPSQVLHALWLAAGGEATALDRVADRRRAGAAVLVPRRRAGAGHDRRRRPCRGAARHKQRGGRDQTVAVDMRHARHRVPQRALSAHRRQAARPGVGQDRRRLHHGR